MTGHATHPAPSAHRGRHAIGAVNSTPSAADDDATALRDDAATLEYIARRWARVLPAGQTDVRADIAMLREIAGNARGYAGSMEATR